jgi:predicted permease
VIRVLARDRRVLGALAAIARLVPSADRAAWLDEWRAEFMHLLDAPSGTRDPHTKGGGASNTISARLGMALRHAWWLRTNPHAPRHPKGDRMRSALDHIRLAARALRREPAFTLPALVTLALGIGANVAVFSVFEAVLLRPLPFADADRIVMLRHHDLRTDLTKPDVARTDVLDIVERQHSFDAIALYGLGRLTMEGDEAPIEVPGIQGTDALFDVARTAVALGRRFTRDDSRRGAEPVVILTDEFWRRQFNADPAVVGRSLTLGSAARRVIGVAAPGFRFPPADRIDVILPMPLPDVAATPRGVGSWILAAGRLKSGVSLATADAELRAISAQLAAEFPAANAGTEYYGRSLRDAMVGEMRRPLLLLMGAVSVVFIIALVNVGNLLLVRATSRRGEVALRLALGAGRRELFVQTLTENLLLAGAATVIGVALAAWGTTALVALVPSTVDVSALGEVGINGAVLGYASAAALLSALVFSLFVSATGARRGAAGAIASQTRHTMSKSARRTAAAMVVAEVALAAVLLVGAGRIVRSFAALLDVDTGFNRNGVSTIALQLPSRPYSDPVRAAAFWNEAMPAIMAVPDVAVAGTAAVMPLTGNNWTVPFVRADRPLPPGQRPPDIGWQVASRGYFDALEIPLRSGRLFSPADASGPPVVIISESVERRFFDAGEGAVGHRITLGKDPAEIIGVVGDIRRASLTDDPRADMYLAVEQQAGDGATVFIRTSSGRPADAVAIRDAVRRIEPNVRVETLDTMDGVAVKSAGPTRLVMWLLGVFSGLSLVLAAIGVYGVLSYAVRQRLREFATRLALGATAGDLVRLVMRDGAIIVTTGLVIGMGVSLIATRAIGALLYSVSAHDPATLTAAAATLLAATILGCYLPARRAARVQPARALAE